MCIALVLTIFVHKTDSLQFNVDHGNKDDAIQMLTKIYPGEMYHVHEEIYNDLRQKGGNSEDS